MSILEPGEVTEETATDDIQFFAMLEEFMDNEAAETFNSFTEMLQSPQPATLPPDAAAGSLADEETFSSFLQMLQSLIFPPQSKTQPAAPPPDAEDGSLADEETFDSFLQMLQSPILPPQSTTQPATQPPETAPTLKRTRQESEDLTPKAKKLKTTPPPRTEQPEYPFSSLDMLKQMMDSPLPATEIRSDEDLEGTRLLYTTSPCFNYCLVAANLAILEATMDRPSIIHIIDFDVQEQSDQLASLIIAIAARHRHQQSGLSSPAPPPVVKITAICDPSCPFNPIRLDGDCRKVKYVGLQLAQLSDQLEIPFRFDIAHCQLLALDQCILGCKTGEALAVKFSFSLSRIGEPMRHQLLCRVKKLDPRVVTLAEKEMNDSDCFTHTQKLLESLEATAELDNTQQACMYAGIARRAANSISAEGADRLEHCELYDSWRARMKNAGFTSVVLGPTVIVPLFQYARSIKTDGRFSVQKKREAALAFNWMNQALTTVSAWH